MKAGNLFTREEGERVEDAVRSARMRTSGEIIPRVVDRSHTYPHLPFLGGMLGWLVASLPAVWLPFDDPHLSLLSCQTLGFAGGFVCLRYWAFLRRALLSPKLMEEQVFQQAHNTFRDLEMNVSRERASVLILVSLLERRVQVLADSGINARVRPGTWNGVVRLVLDGARSGDLSGGLCKAVERCGEILEKEFPRKSANART